MKNKKKTEEKQRFLEDKKVGKSGEESKERKK